MTPREILAADLNGDHKTDLIVTSTPVPPAQGGGGNGLMVLLGNGDSTFATGSQFDLAFTPWAVLTIGDFNRDGKPDIAIATDFGLSDPDRTGNAVPVRRKHGLPGSSQCR